MEKELSSVDTLKNIAKKSGWDFNLTEKLHHFRVGQHERYIVIKNPEVKDSIFLSSQKVGIDKYKIYSGIFYPVNGYEKYTLLIKNRNPLDKLSFIKNRKRFKIGSNNFDSKINITTNNDIETHKLLSSAKTQIEIVEFLKRSYSLHIGINEINPKFPEEMSGKSYLSVFIAMEWMLEKDMIDSAFKLGNILYEKLSKKL